MPINAGYEYTESVKKYEAAQTDEERIIALQEMLRTVPSHKGTEKYRGDMRLKIKKLKEQVIKAKKTGKGKKGIKKEDLQAAIVGFTNAGKSSLLKAITNANPRIESYGFTTMFPEIGTMNFAGCNIQMIDMPPIGSEAFDYGVVNNSDTIVLVVEKISDIEEVTNLLRNKKAKIIIVFNKIDLYDNNSRRKILETLKTKKYNFVIVSTFNKEGLEELKEKIFKSFNIIRIYTRQPGKKEDKVPVIMPPDSTLEEVAEKVLHGFSKKVKYAKVFGPSGKFLGQRIGLKHVVKDRDIVELYTE